MSSYPRDMLPQGHSAAPPAPAHSVVPTQSRAAWRPLPNRSAPIANLLLHQERGLSGHDSTGLQPFKPTFLKPSQRRRGDSVGTQGEGDGFKCQALVPRHQCLPSWAPRDWEATAGLGSWCPYSPASRTGLRLVTDPSRRFHVRLLSVGGKPTFQHL